MTHDDLPALQGEVIEPAGPQARNRDPWGKPYPWWQDTERRFEDWQRAHPDAPVSSTFLAWQEADRRARRNYRARAKRRVSAPT